MIPTVGRIIHVRYDVEQKLTLPCRPAIVTGIDHKPMVIFCTVFNKAGAAITAVINPEREDNPYDWHDPRECPDIGADL